MNTNKVVQLYTCIIGHNWWYSMLLDTCYSTVWIHCTFYHSFWLMTSWTILLPTCFYVWINRRLESTTNCFNCKSITTTHHYYLSGLWLHLWERQRLWFSRVENVRIESLYPIPYSHMTPLFFSLNGFNALGCSWNSILESMSIMHTSLSIQMSSHVQI